ncbi:MAG TPA: anthranilate phosphoribosyltransferase [Candidatus Saccharimonadales bacterium]|nr:anthranilate phosphoribosyltransferase [Candidatus Saccharimonadales bacterium]
MRIVEFLKKTVAGDLSLDEQKEYLRQKPFGSAEEIAEAVEYLYEQMAEVPKLEDGVDICGTGGSGLPRLNTSTISAFILAGAGVKVAKHGNNAASGNFGSFDLLSALDIPINLSSEQLQLRYNRYNLAFLYAKSFHPAMRFFGPVRSEMDKPTFFNILGPLLSPVKAKRQLIGTTRLEYARIIAEVSRILGKKRVVVAVGSDGLDEVTLCGRTHVVELDDGKIKEYELNPADFGIKAARDFSEIATKDPEDNIRIANLILDGKEKTRRTDLVLVNAALALYVAGKTYDLREAYKLAERTLKTGKAKEILQNYRLPSALANIAARDKKRDFTAAGKLPEAGKRYSGGLIAEIKRASPSEGLINTTIDIAEQARLYEQAGASAISVLCEPEDFGGSFEDLKLVRKTVNLPLLCKDFIFRKEHIYKAKSSGADIVLLIAAILDEEQLFKLHDYAKSLGLQSIVEVHDRNELRKALKLKPEIIGVNSRNLHDFSLNPEIFTELAKHIPAGTVAIAESGIGGYRDIPKDYEGVLVGTVLMKHQFPQLKIKELTGRPLLKLCGMRRTENAKLCEKLGVDMIGINFVSRSHRQVSIEEAKQLVAACDNTIPVGVFENQTPEEVNEIAKKTGVRAIQLSGEEKDLQSYNLPIIKTVRLGEKRPDGAFLTIIDNSIAGSGKKIDHSKLEKFEPSLIAGGIDLATAENLFKNKFPLGIDTASGIETDGKVDPGKLKAMSALAASVKYE